MKQTYSLFLQNNPALLSTINYRLNGRSKLEKEFSFSPAQALYIILPFYRQGDTVWIDS